MSNFFAFATKNSWDEDVFQLTTGGILTIVALIVILIAAALFIHSRKGSHKLSTKQLVFSAVAMALGTVTSMLSCFTFQWAAPLRCSVCCSLLLIGYWYGPEVGIMTSVAYGLLQFVIDPVFYSIPQLLVDYPLAFGALGLSGFFHDSKHGLSKATSSVCSGDMSLHFYQDSYSLLHTQREAE